MGNGIGAGPAWQVRPWGLDDEFEKYTELLGPLKDFVDAVDCRTERVDSRVAREVLGADPRPKNRIAAAEKAGQPAPGRPDPFQLEWIEACKGNRNNFVTGMSSKTHCDFDYSGTMIEQMLLGLVAHRAGKKLEYDGQAGRVTNMAEANEWLKRTYRPNWKLDG